MFTAGLVMTAPNWKQPSCPTDVKEKQTAVYFQIMIKRKKKTIDMYNKMDGSQKWAK